jgi:hypothetical protein
VSEEAGADVRLRLACRIAEKAYLSEQKVVVLLDDADALRRFDELLWTFGDGSFVPHDSVAAAGSPCEAPVALTTPARCRPITPTCCSTSAASFPRVTRNSHAWPNSSMHGPRCARQAASGSASIAVRPSSPGRTTSDGSHGKPP